MSIPVTSGLIALLDPSTLVLADGATVTSGLWTDSSGNGIAGAATIGAGGTGPIYKTNIFGTKPAVRFGGAASTGLYGTLASWGGSGATFLLGITNASKSANNPYAGYFGASIASSGNDSDNTNSFVILQAGGTGTAGISSFYNNSGTIIDDGGGVVYPPSSPTVLGLGLLPGTNAVNSINGQVTSKITNASSAFGTPTRYFLGNRWLGGAISTLYSTLFDLGMMAIYNRRLTDAEFQSAGQWMMANLGIQGTSLLVVEDD